MAPLRAASHTTAVYVCLCFFVSQTVVVAEALITVNNYDGDINFGCDSNAALVAMDSFHDNGAEDRIFQLGCAEASVTASKDWRTDWLNNMDQELYFNCPQNQVIFHVASYHSNNEEDRRWNLGCREVASGVVLTNCVSFGDWVNNYDGAATFRAPANSLITGIKSWHSNNYEDRIWTYSYCGVGCSTGVGLDGRVCRQCNPGTYQPNNAHAAPCISCERGKSQQDYGQTACNFAPPGRYAPNTGMSTTVACERGKYQVNSGQTGCNFCEAHYYQELEGQASCKFSCAWSDKYCFPCTSCDQSSSSCQNGFSGSRCTTVDVNPAVLSPELMLIREGTSPAQSVYPPIDLTPGGHSGTVYVSIASTAAVVGWGHAFQSSGAFVAQSPATYSDWVTASRVGITAATLRIDGLATTPNAYNFQGNGVPSATAPHVSTVVGMTATFSSTRLNPSHGTMRLLRLTISNGGYADLSLLTAQDSATRTASRQLLSGRTVDTTVTLHYDFTAPTQADHSQQLSVNAPGGLSTTRTINVAFVAWHEPTSYITHYSVSLCPMSTGTSILTEQQGNDANGQPYCSEPVLTEATVPYRATSTTAPPAATTITLPTDDTLWSLVLVVKDAAGNVGHARRLALVNTNPRVDISTIHEILVTTAGNNGNVPPDARELWQTSTNTRYAASWADVFSDLRNAQWLKPISRNGIHGLLTAYDHLSDGRSRTGTLHTTGTPNRLGITRFETAFTCLTCPTEPALAFALTPGSELAADTLPPLALSVDQHLVNGHWYQLHVRATNVFGATATAASRSFGIDVTPPEIEKLAIMRNGRELAVHNLNDLQKMNLTFRAFDTESGLRQLEWSLHAHRQLAPGEPEQDALVADASIDVKPVADASTCQAHGAEACLCGGFVGEFCYLRDYSFPLDRYLQLAQSDADRHGRNFTFFLAVTNRAGLRTETSINVLVDATPPDTRAAAVLEGPVAEAAGAAHLAPGAERDVDYVADAQVVVRFRGFVDHESDIHTYLWTVGPTCMHEGAVFAEGAPALANFTRSTSGAQGWDTYTAPAPGHYVVSAFAYNNAWEPSAVVCSDGITYDPAAPEVASVRMSHLVTVAGRVRDDNGELWVVHANLTRSRVAGGSASCVASAAAPLASAAKWALYPEAAAFGGSADTVAAAVACVLPPLAPQLYLGVEANVNVGWVITGPHAHIHDTALALASAEDALKGDFAAFQSVSAARPSILLSDLGLENGNEFFLLLRVTKKSKATTTLAFGPVLVASRPPRLPSGLSVPADNTRLVETDVSGLALRMRWPKLVGTGIEYSVGVGRATGGASLDELLPFAPASTLQADAACSWNFSTASALPTDAPCASVRVVQLQGGGAYVVAVRACTAASVCVVLTSMPQPAVAHGPPQAGLVYDVGDGDELENGADAAAQTTLGQLRLQWRHFDTDGSTVNYEVGVGSAPGQDDVAQLRPTTGLPLRAGWREATIPAQLNASVRYYATVRASNSLGSVTVSSDGVVPLPPGALQVAFGDGTGNCSLAAPNLLAEPASFHFDLDAAATEVSIEIKATLQPGQRYVWRLRAAQQEAGSVAGVLELRIGTAHVLMPIGDQALPPRCCCSIAVNGSFHRSCSRAERYGYDLADTCACPQAAEGEGTAEMSSVIGKAWAASSPLELPFRAAGVRATLTGRFWPGNNASLAAGLRLVLDRLVHCDAQGGAVPLAGSGTDATAGAVHAWWHWPTDTAADNATLALRAHVTHFEWAVQLRNGTRENLVWLRDYTSAGWAWEARTPSAISLPAGTAAVVAEAAARTDVPGPALYFVVRACHATGCWASQRSPPQPLTVGVPQAAEDSLSLAYTQDFPPGSTTKVELQFTLAAHAVPVVMYQWALEHGGVGGAQLVSWQTVPSYAMALAVAQANASGVGSNEAKIVLQRTVPVDLSLYDTAPTFVRLRAFGADGAVGETVARARATTLLPPQYHVAVLDVDEAMAQILLSSTPHGPPTAAETAVRAAQTGVADIALAAAANGTLAAAWPELWPTYRADYYLWSVATVREYINCSLPSAGADVLACGKTHSRAVVARDLAVVEGRTYYVCIQAGPHTPTEAVNRRNAAEARPVLPSCSNGVTVDRSPPVAGVVAIGHAHTNHVGPLGATEGTLHFQRDTHSVLVRWHGFSDASHAPDSAVPYDSGVAKYMIRLGSTPGQADVIGPLEVGGGTTHLRVANLTLASGRGLVATVDAHDFVGLQTRAVSAPVLIDATPPTFRTGARVSVVQRPAAGAVALDKSNTGKAVLKVSWVGFEDAESRIAGCSWAVGRAPHRADLAPFLNAGLATSASRVVQLAEGRVFAVTVRCTNRAGLWAEAVADGLVAATVPPAGGHVFDGSILGQDIDYQAATNVLTANWGGFVDAAGGGGVAHYAWGVGTQAGLTDFLAFREVGLATRAHVESLRLHPGETYFFAVRACGASGLCTTRVSDGVVPDNSPPVAGPVLDGGHAWDLDVQAFAGAITASWSGFHDAHSGIARYTWCVGTTPRQCDLLNATDVGLDTRATTTAVALPANGSERVYVTVKAYNGAGLTVTAASDGIALDTAPPHVVVAPRFEPVGSQPDVSLPAASHDHQISRSVLRGSWAFADTDGGALRYWYTVDTHHEGEAIAVDAVALEDGFVLAGLQLSEGDTYYLRVTVCDEAERCITANAERPITIDGSPPTTGRLVDDMAWSSSTVTLVWANIVDPHSGVAEYVVAVGSTMAGDDIVARQVIPAGVTGDGSVGSAILETKRSLAAGELLFITFVAVNPLGLSSLPLHAEARAMAGASGSGGVLQLILHQCESLFCDQQCTCGPYGRCPLSPYGSSCSQLSAAAGVTVHDGFVAGEDADEQVEVNVLAASWTGVISSGKRVQYMAGAVGKAPGSMLFSLAGHERTTWFEAAPGSNRAVLPLPDGRTLAHAQRYVFYIRVWEDMVSYREYVSDGVTIDTVAPLASALPKIEAALPAAVPSGVVLANVTDAADIASSNGTMLGLDWTDSFRDVGEGLAYYEWALGHRPGTTDVHPLSRVATSVTRVQATNLTLTHGDVAFATVRAVDKSGLSIWRSSLPLAIDVSPPEVGAVLDGLGPHDEEAQGTAARLSAIWHGFYDAESGIVAYEVAFARAGAAVGEPDIVPWTVVGLNTSVTFSVALQDGERYAARVRAYNSLGLRSVSVQSDGVVVDLSPPVALPPCSTAENASNLIQDAAIVLDSNVSRVAVADISTAQYGYRLPSWSVLSQTVTTEPKQRYRLQFLVAVEGAYPGARQGGRVTVDDTGGSAPALVVRTFEARHPGLHASATWTRHVVDFEAKHAATRVTLMALPWGGEATPLLLTQPTLVACGTSAGMEASDTVVDVGPAVQGASDTLVASWHLADAHSALEEVLWAVGTSPGGTQLQEFMPAPHTGVATAYGLALPHNGSVYVTVAARNTVGHVARFDSAAVHIDRTPPAITALEQAEAVTASAADLDVIWVAADAESNVVWCQIGLGRASAAVGDGLLAFDTVNATRSTAGTDAWHAKLPAAAIAPLAHGERAVAAVRCGNAAGLLTERQSLRGTLRLIQPLTTTKAWVRIAQPTGNPVAPFEPVTGTQTDTTGFVAFWGGFGGHDGDNAHVASYEVRLTGPEQAGIWSPLGRVEEAHVNGIVLHSGNLYTVEVRATDLAGVVSATVSADVRVLTTAPVATDSSLCATWPQNASSSGVLSLGWLGAFKAAPCPAVTDPAAHGLEPATCLRYVVSVGRNVAGGDVVREAKTGRAMLAVPASRLLRLADLSVDESVEYMVAVTAINAAGMGTTRQFAVQGAPQC